MKEPTIIKDFPGKAVEQFRLMHGGRLPHECCYYCEQWEKEMRPYGPKGAWVCFACAMQPEHKAETKANFCAQLEAAGPISVIGEETGPRPIDGGKL
jgi:hypothetical protein